MFQAKCGDTVKVKYAAKLETGGLIDASAGSGPVEFKLGSGDVIPGFEKAVIGMVVGERKTVLVNPEEAFGRKVEGSKMVLSKKAIPEHISLETGQKIQAQKSDGTDLELYITCINEYSITLEENHPLAGEKLELSIELVNIS